eukprot:jgi/Hompol1/3481/HPOL_006559-RA
MIGSITSVSDPAVVAEVTALLDTFIADFLAATPNTTIKRPVDLLFKLHRYMVCKIPYQTISCAYGDKPSTDPLAICRKLVSRKFGGYCLEVNPLAALALERLGYVVETRSVYVAIMPRTEDEPHVDTHILLLVALPPGADADRDEPRRWMFDAGGFIFSPYYPVPLVDNPNGVETHGPGGVRLRLVKGTVREKEGWILKTRIDFKEPPVVPEGALDFSKPVTAFFFQDVPAADQHFNDMNIFTSAPRPGHSSQDFVVTRAIDATGERQILAGNPEKGWSLATRDKDGAVNRVPIQDPNEVSRLLKEHFDIEFDLAAVATTSNSEETATTA